MSKINTIVALDAMGGDNAPQAMVQGAVDAVNGRDDVLVKLVGIESSINQELAKYNYPKDRIEVVNATEVIETAEHPVMAIKKKKDSSLVVALRLVKEKEADAAVSCGNSGALLAGGLGLVGRIKGVERPPFGAVIPSKKGAVLLADSGANVDVRASHLVQFAKMGSIYMRDVMGISNPKVAILNIGAEEEKGNALVKETFPLLKECSDINFVGSIEARNVPEGDADVVICDGFAGNVLLKMYEGTASTMLSLIKSSMKSNILTMLGAAFCLPALKKNLGIFDPAQYGGAPLLGLNGLVVKSHGSAKAVEVTNSIYQCITFKDQNIIDKFRENLVNKEEKED